ncbi:uncharacterized protein LACBIDRAFT_330690 [Laccaria bicolor S238N-H82]|uniref:Predicted protein n=1 Tax=Laccaria bicolor (strain S238N-H82 / ATCC MYA-4686) TaxID=486041 RepID=B0DM50_LACBS|nr:uncharacterized protein LACBIDRAFT_330690 [Laccaria bicolor S238N-H82]EDR04504.1 predicted protein [Laccaria bicolor S238N-H82]|eukprot:XP_001885023.1 predicted protein [Laccaria bicolor S238N-H82]
MPAKPPPTVSIQLKSLARQGLSLTQELIWTRTEDKAHMTLWAFYLLLMYPCLVSNVSSAPTETMLPLAPIPSVPSVTPENVASALIPLAMLTLILNNGNTKPTLDPCVININQVDQAMSPVSTPEIPAKVASVPVPLATLTLNDSNTELTLNPHPMDVDKVKGTTSPSAPTLATNGQDDELKAALMDVDRVSGTNNLTLSISTVVNNPSKLLTWLTSNGMLGYLHGISEVKAWQDLVLLFFKFEMENTITGNLPTTHVQKRFHVESRYPHGVHLDSSFIYAMPAAEDWCSLHKGGAAGLYTVVMALSWWIKALSPADSSIYTWTAVHDVSWVINHISEKIGRASQGKKQGCKEPSLSGKGKRFISISSFHYVS